MRILFLISILSRCTQGIYQVYKDEKSWDDSMEYCQLNNGKLAHLYNMSAMHEYLTSTNESFWVGGSLHDQGFNWVTNDDKGTPLKELIHHRGCYKPSSITGAQQPEQNSAENCFKACNWTKSIGLKSFYCSCDYDYNMGTLTRTKATYCESRCNGNTTQLCGGPKGVSIYNINNDAVIWGDNEPNSEYECAYLKKFQEGDIFRWFVASCQMRMRYICFYENHNACGIQKSCLRPSVRPETWEKSLENCRLLNGTTAIIDVTKIDNSDDVKHIPPGEYWIGLKRQRRWEWTNGLPISSRYFHHRQMPTTTGNQCAAFSWKGNSLGLSSAPCLEKRRFICKYDLNIKRTYQTTISLPMSDVGEEFPEISKAEIKTNDRNISMTTKDPGYDEGAYYQNSLYKSIMYLAIGVASGMAFVFSICLIVYVGRRIKARKTEFKTVRYPKNIGNPVLRYANDTPTNHASAEPEVLYEIPCDAQESPFRVTQRALQQNYAINRDGFPSNSWRRKKSEKERNGQQLPRHQPEIRHIHPYTDRSYGDTSYIIHNVHAQVQPTKHLQKQPIDITYTGSLDTRLRKPPQNRDNEVRLSDTYSLPEQGRKLSEPMLRVDTSDLYACVEKAMHNIQDEYYDNDDPNIRVTLC